MIERLPFYRKHICNWVNELVYYPMPKRGVIKVVLWDYQEECLTEATQTIEIDGKQWNKYSTIAISIAKRNSKTFMASLILAWKFMCFYNVEGVVASNSSDQASSTVFDTFKKIIINSPALIKIVGINNILDKEVRLPATQSGVNVISANKASSWGKGIDIGVVDEIHAAPDGEGLYQILASQTGDRDGQIILPSQTSDQSNIFYRLYKINEEKADKSLYFYYKGDDAHHPKTVKEYNPSPLVTEQWLNSRKKQLTKLQYDCWHRNLWGAAGSKFLSEEMIGNAVNSGSDYDIPVTKSKLREWELRLMSNFVVGAGLDRAQSYSKHDDRTIWTVVAKCFTIQEDVEKELYLILDQRVCRGADEIKQAIIFSDQQYGLNNIVFEVFQASDLHEWAIEQGLKSELIHAIDKNQVAAFNKFYEVFSYGMIAIPENLPADYYDDGRNYIPILIRELQEFETTLSGNVPKFGHPAGSKFKDDSVYSLAWAIHSLREEMAAPVRRPETSTKNKYIPRNKFTGI